MKIIYRTQAWIILCSVLLVSSTAVHHSHHHGMHYGDRPPRWKGLPAGIPVQVPHHIQHDKEITCISSDPNIFEIMNQAKAQCRGKDTLCSFYFYSNGKYYCIDSFKINKELFSILLMNYDNWMLTTEKIDNIAGLLPHNDFKAHNINYRGSDPVNTLHTKEKHKFLQNDRLQHEIEVEGEENIDNSKDMNFNVIDNSNINDLSYRKNDENSVKTHNIKEESKHKNYELLNPMYDKNGEYYELKDEVEYEEEENVVISPNTYKNKFNKVVNYNTLDNININDLSYEGNVASSVKTHNTMDQLKNRNYISLNPTYDKNNKYYEVLLPKDKNRGHPNTINVQLNPDRNILSDYFGEINKYKSTSINFEHLSKDDEWGDHEKEHAVEVQDTDYPHHPSDFTAKSHKSRPTPEMDEQDIEILSLNYQETPEQYINNEKHYVDLQNINDHKTTTDAVPSFSKQNKFISKPQHTHKSVPNIKTADKIHIYNDIDFDHTHHFSAHEDNKVKPSHIHLNEPVSLIKHTTEEYHHQEPILPTINTNPQLEIVSSPNDDIDTSNIEDIYVSSDSIKSVEVLETEQNPDSHESSSLTADSHIVDLSIDQPPTLYTLSIPTIMPKPPIESVLLIKTGSESSPFNVGYSWLPSYSRIQELRSPNMISPLSSTQIVSKLETDSLLPAFSFENQSETSANTPLFSPVIPLPIDRIISTSETDFLMPVPSIKDILTGKLFISSAKPTISTNLVLPNLETDYLMPVSSLKDLSVETLDFPLPNPVIPLSDEVIRVKDTSSIMPVHNLKESFASVPVSSSSIPLTFLSTNQILPSQETSSNMPVPPFKDTDIQTLDSALPGLAIPLSEHVILSEEKVSMMPVPIFEHSYAATTGFPSLNPSISVLTNQILPNQNENHKDLPIMILDSPLPNQKTPLPTNFILHPKHETDLPVSSLKNFYQDTLVASPISTIPLSAYEIVPDIENKFLMPVPSFKDSWLDNIVSYYPPRYVAPTELDLPNTFTVAETSLYDLYHKPQTKQISTVDFDFLPNSQLNVRPGKINSVTKQFESPESSIRTNPKFKINLVNYVPQYDNSETYSEEFVQIPIDFNPDLFNKNPNYIHSYMPTPDRPDKHITKNILINKEFDEPMLNNISLESLENFIKQIVKNEPFLNRDIIQISEGKHLQPSSVKETSHDSSIITDSVAHLNLPPILKSESQSYTDSTEITVETSNQPMTTEHGKQISKIPVIKSKLEKPLHSSDILEYLNQPAYTPKSDLYIFNQPPITPPIFKSPSLNPLTSSVLNQLPVSAEMSIPLEFCPHVPTIEPVSPYTPIPKPILNQNQLSSLTVPKYINTLSTSVPQLQIPLPALLSRKLSPAPIEPSLFNPSCYIPQLPLSVPQYNVQSQSQIPYASPLSPNAYSLNPNIPVASEIIPPLVAHHNHPAISSKYTPIVSFLQAPFSNPFYSPSDLFVNEKLPTVPGNLRPYLDIKSPPNLVNFYSPESIKETARMPIPGNAFPPDIGIKPSREFLLPTVGTMQNSNVNFQPAPHTPLVFDTPEFRPNWQVPISTNANVQDSITRVDALLNSVPPESIYQEGSVQYPCVSSIPLDMTYQTAPRSFGPCPSPAPNEYESSSEPHYFPMPCRGWSPDNIYEMTEGADPISLSNLEFVAPFSELRPTSPGTFDKEYFQLNPMPNLSQNQAPFAVNENKRQDVVDTKTFTSEFLESPPLESYNLVLNNEVSEPSVQSNTLPDISRCTSPMIKPLKTNVLKPILPPTSIVSPYLRSIYPLLPIPTSILPNNPHFQLEHSIASMADLTISIPNPKYSCNPFTFSDEITPCLDSYLNLPNKEPNQQNIILSPENTKFIHPQSVFDLPISNKSPIPDINNIGSNYPLSSPYQQNPANPEHRSRYPKLSDSNSQDNLMSQLQELSYSTSDVDQSSQLPITGQRISDFPSSSWEYPLITPGYKKSVRPNLSYTLHSNPTSTAYTSVSPNNIQQATNTDLLSPVSIKSDSLKQLYYNNYPSDVEDTRLLLNGPSPSTHSNYFETKGNVPLSSLSPEFVTPVVYTSPQSISRDLKYSPNYAPSSQTLYDSSALSPVTSTPIPTSDINSLINKYQLTLQKPYVSTTNNLHPYKETMLSLSDINNESKLSYQLPLPRTFNAPCQQIPSLSQLSDYEISKLLSSSPCLPEYPNILIHDQKNKIENNIDEDLYTEPSSSTFTSKEATKLFTENLISTATDFASPTFAAPVESMLYQNSQLSKMSGPQHEELISTYSSPFPQSELIPSHEYTTLPNLSTKKFNQFAPSVYSPQLVDKLSSTASSFSSSEPLTELDESYSFFPSRSLLHTIPSLDIKPLSSLRYRPCDISRFKKPLSVLPLPSSITTIINEIPDFGTPVNLFQYPPLILTPAYSNTLKNLVVSPIKSVPLEEYGKPLDFFLETLPHIPTRPHANFAPTPSLTRIKDNLTPIDSTVIRSKPWNSIQNIFNTIPESNAIKQKIAFNTKEIGHACPITPAHVYPNNIQNIFMPSHIGFPKASNNPAVLKTSKNLHLAPQTSVTPDNFMKLPSTNQYQLRDLKPLYDSQNLYPQFLSSNYPIETALLYQAPSPNSYITESPHLPACKSLSDPTILKQDISTTVCNALNSKFTPWGRQSNLDLIPTQTSKYPYLEFPLISVLDIPTACSSDDHLASDPDYSVLLSNVKNAHKPIKIHSMPAPCPQQTPIELSNQHLPDSTLKSSQLPLLNLLSPCNLPLAPILDFKYPIYQSRNPYIQSQSVGDFPKTLRNRPISRLSTESQDWPKASLEQSSPISEKPYEILPGESYNQNNNIYDISRNRLSQIHPITQTDLDSQKHIKSSKTFNKAHEEIKNVSVFENNIELTSNDRGTDHSFDNYNNNKHIFNKIISENPALLSNNLDLNKDLYDEREWNDNYDTVANYIYDIRNIDNMISDIFHNIEYNKQFADVTIQNLNKDESRATELDTNYEQRDSNPNIKIVTSNLNTDTSKIESRKLDDFDNLEEIPEFYPENELYTANTESRDHNEKTWLNSFPYIVNLPTNGATNKFRYSAPTSYLNNIPTDSLISAITNTNKNLPINQISYTPVTEYASQVPISLKHIHSNDIEYLDRIPTTRNYNTMPSQAVPQIPFNIKPTEFNNPLKLFGYPYKPGVPLRIHPISYNHIQDIPTTNPQISYLDSQNVLNPMNIIPANFKETQAYQTPEEVHKIHDDLTSLPDNNIKYAGYKTYQYPSINPLRTNDVIDTQHFYNPTKTPQTFIPMQYQKHILDIPLKINPQNDLDLGNPENLITNEDIPTRKNIELETSLINYIKNDNDVNNNIKNNVEFSIPLRNIAIIEKDPNPSYIIKTQHPNVGLKVWKSNLKLVEAEIRLKFKDLSVLNFMPVVKNLNENDVQEIRNIVKNYIDEKYGAHIEVDEPYTIYNQYTVLKDHNVVDNKCNILWPTNNV